MDDLYSLKPPARGWRHCTSEDAKTSERRVEWAPVPLHPDVYAVRDSKNRAAGTLMFTGSDLAAFAAAFKQS